MLFRSKILFTVVLLPFILVALAFAGLLYIAFPVLIVIGLIAGILVLCDGVVAKLFGQEATFIWVAFISWTVFLNVNIEERLKVKKG